MRTGWMIGGLLLATPAFAQDPQPNAASQPPEPELSADIVVTAQRRSERLQDVPVAVTAISSDALVSRQLQNLADITATVPNIHVSNNIGQGSATTVFLRGVGDTESIITVDTPVGFYLDDVYIGRQGVNNMALFDVDRIEVLRGPQGTLYGRNTSAGAIKVITRQPSFTETDGKAELVYGRFNTWSIRAAAGAPLSSKAAFRISAIYGDGDGDTYNRTLRRQVNGTEIVGVRPSLRVAPTDDVDLTLSGDWTRNNQNGRYGVDVSGVLRPPSGDLYVATTDTDIRNVGEAGGVNLTAAWTVSPSATLKSISAWRYTTQRYNLELTDQAPSLYTLFSTARTDQYSQELQLSGSALEGRLDYVAGFYYFKEVSRQYLGDYIFQLLFFDKNLRVNTDSYAGYGQVNWRFADKLTLIVGGRYTEDDKSVRVRQLFGGTPGFNPVGGVFSFDTSTVEGQITPARPGRPVRTNLTFNKFTPKAGIEYRPNRDLLLYFTYTQGFKSGGWSARVTDPTQFIDYDPETIDSYEIGIKSSPFNRRATINLTGFYYDYKGLFSTGTRSDGSFGIATSNAKIYGIELETTGRFTRAVRGYLNASWQNGNREGVTAATLELGRRFQRFPEWQVATGVNVDQPVSARFNLIANAEYNYTSEHYVNPQNTAPALTGPISLVNASVGFGTSDGRYQLIAGCRNCFGEKYINQILDFAALGFTTVYPGERSTWTITARARF